MKIGLVCPYSVAHGGGVQEVVYALQAELSKRGHEAYIITPEPLNYDPKFIADKNILFVGQSSDLNSPTHTTMQVSAGLNEHIDELLDEYNFDVLHFHEPWVPMVSRQIISRSKCPNIATSHATLPGTPVSRTIIKMVTPYARSVLKFIDAYTAVSEPASEFIRSLGVKKIDMVPNGIELKNFTSHAKLKPGNKNKTIFYVGRLENRKGVNYLIKAMAVLCERRPEVRLIIAGSGPDRKKLELLTKNLELTKSIKFVGFISDAEKLNYLKTADLACFPALYGESFGIVLLEAMASGLVTVAGNNPGYASVLKDLGALSLVNPKDSLQFAHRLELMLYEEDLRKLWRNWAKANVEQYDYKNITDQYEEIYKRVVFSKRRNRVIPKPRPILRAARKVAAAKRKRARLAKR